MNKKLIAVAAAGILIAGTAALIIINHRPQSGEVQENSDVSGRSETSAVSEQEIEAPFDFVCTDRLCGYPETERHIKEDSIEAVFADAGTVIKAYSGAQSADDDIFADASEQEISGMTVAVKGENGMIQFARWSYNGFTYTVSINDINNSVSPEEMSDYILSIK